MSNLARILAGALAAGLLCGALGCTPKPAPGAQPPADDACMLFPGRPDAFGSVAVALTDDVDISRAPVPRNTSERLLFGLLYETLIRVDCNGRVLPLLAEKWEPYADGREWRFTLRTGARFWDGSLVTAQDVVSSWWATNPGRGPATRAPWIGPEAATAGSDRWVVVTLSEPRASVPVEFADPQFAVTKPSDAWGWPVGTGSRRPSGPFVQVGAKDSKPVIIAYPTSSSSMFLRFLLAAGSDARDLLDARVDLIVADRHAREYSATLPDFVAVPLPWERVYVVLSPSALEEFGAALPQAARQALARDVVRADGRGAEPPYWWEQIPACGLTQSGIPAPPPATRRIVYEESDPQARALSERLVALAASMSNPGGANRTSASTNAFSTLAPDSSAAALAAGMRADPQAVGLEAKELESALRSGKDLAYVLALPVRVGLACVEARTLLQRAPWLVSSQPFRTPGVASGEVVAQDAVALGPRILPLVETRPWLIARKGLAGVGLSGDGAPRLDAVGWLTKAGTP